MDLSEWIYLNGHFDLDISIWTHKIVYNFWDFVIQPYLVQICPLQIYPFFSHKKWTYLNGHIVIDMSIKICPFSVIPLFLPDPKIIDQYTNKVTNNAQELKPLLFTLHKFRNRNI
jgi:hypothetical protein